MNKLEAINQAWFLVINANDQTPTWMIELAIFLAQDIIYLVPLLVVLLWLGGNSQTRETTIKAVLVTILALIIAQAIRWGWPHPRPFTMELGQAWLYHKPNSSFPSNHMAVFMGIAIPLLAGKQRLWGGITFVVGLAVAWARIFVGVHFPLDMLGSLIVALIAYQLIQALWPTLHSPLVNLSNAVRRRIGLKV